MSFPDPNPYLDKSTRQEWAILQLMKRTGFPIMQENGQRRYGPPPDWTGPPPPKGSEVFMGHLPRDVFEDILVPLFSSIGPIYQLRLMMDFSGTSRGYGFVEYTCPGDAQRAVAELDHYKIRPHFRIGVVMSVDNCRLFICRIPKDKTAEEIKEEISFYTDNVVRTIVFPSFYYNSQNRGFALVEYATHRDAAMARRKLLPGSVRLFGVEVRVDWAEPESYVDPEIMSKVKILFVNNLHPGFNNERMLCDLFKFRDSSSQQLNVTRAKKVCQFAFVHYATRGQAETALRLAQAKNFGQSLSSDGTRLHVRYAKPPGTSPCNRRFNRHIPQFGYRMGRTRGPCPEYSNDRGNRTTGGGDASDDLKLDIGWSTQSSASWDFHNSAQLEASVWAPIPGPAPLPIGHGAPQRSASSVMRQNSFK